MNFETAARVWHRFLGGESIDPREERQLLDLLERDAALRATLLADTKIHGLLASARGERENRAFVAKVRRLLEAQDDGVAFVSRFRSRLNATPVRPGLSLRPLFLAAAVLLVAAALWAVARPFRPAPDPAIPLAARRQPAPAAERRPVFDRAPDPLLPPSSTPAAPTAPPPQVEPSKAAPLEPSEEEPPVVPVPTPSPVPAPPPEPPTPAARPPAETRTSVARLERLEGEAWIDEARAQEGESLAAGQVLRAGAAQALLTLAAGARVSVDAGTRLRATEREIVLDEGSVAVSVDPRRGGEAFLVSTAHVRVRVTGTRFLVWSAGGTTRVDVEEGRVQLSRPGGSATVELSPDQFAVLGPGMPLARRTLTGLRAEYYESQPDRPFMERRASRLDPEIDFVWGARPPLPALRTAAFGVRWSGLVQPRTSELYTFTMRSSCGARVWVDGLKVIEHWADHDAGEASGTIRLEAGRAYPIRVDYYSCDGVVPVDAQARLSWSSPSLGRQIVPRTHLLPGP